VLAKVRESGNNPDTGGESEMDRRAHKRLVVLGVALIASIGLAGALIVAQGSSSRGTLPVSPPAPTASQLTTIRAKVLAFAAGHGDTSPSDGQVIATTRQAAVAATTSGGAIPSTFDQGVYLVVVHGTFNDSSYDPLPDSPPQTYHIATLDVDPATGQVLGSSLSDALPDLSAMGPPIPLDLPTK
jgi:hypothetical protein